MSNLKDDILLKDHTTVVYEDGGKQLPESHNGLGYMNLISMIFEIESIRKQFVRPNERKPADINLLFIEEPEAHTHPQMQYVFIKNIKQLLKQAVKGKDGVIREIQAVVTTHSAHIVSECDFEDLKYLKRDIEKGIIAKNLSDLESEYGGHPEWFGFLKQYLTLDRSELFFADKAIFVEGDTERILMPTFMKMADDTKDLEKGECKLTSQNISIVAVGNYTHIFTRFFNFIGFKKICIVTDLDICNKDSKIDKSGVARTVYVTSSYDGAKEQYTTNASLKYFFDNSSISVFRAKNNEGRRIRWNELNEKWESHADGNVMVCYQSDVDGYQPRSFEDAFFETNKAFMTEEGKVFNGLMEGAIELFRENGRSFDLAQNGIKSKATFAIDLLIDRENKNKEGYVGWSIPQYIMDGLLWLRKD